MAAEQQLNTMELDYSAIVQPPVKHSSRWVPPRHVYFGKKDAEGMPTPEPVYEHQAYPSLRYKAEDGRIKVTLVDTAEEADLFNGDGWKDTPAAFGYIGAPDIKTVLKMRADAEERAREAAAKASNTLTLPKKDAKAA